MGHLDVRFETFDDECDPHLNEGRATTAAYFRGIEDGCCLFGLNVAGAMRLAKDMGPGHTIVTMLCDSGTRYQSKMFNPTFLAEKGLPVPDWL